MGCAGKTEPVRGQFLVFGTQVEVLIRSHDEALAEIALRELGDSFQQMHSDWHPWQPGALTRLNQQLSSGQRAPADPAILAMIRDAQRLEQSSQGLFNAAIGGLIELWGFHTSHYPITAPPPGVDKINQWLSDAPSALDLRISDQYVQSSNPAVELDFSGLAKGYAAKLACEGLIADGLGDALINLGGDVMICDQGQQAWTIAISDGQGGVFKLLEARGPLAIFSSGTTQRWGEWQGQRYAHLLDPNSGQALPHAIQATVINPDPVLADAAATSLAVAGQQRWMEIAEAMSVDEVLLLDEAGLIAVTPGFAASGPLGNLDFLKHPKNLTPLTSSYAGALHALIGTTRRASRARENQNKQVKPLKTSLQEARPNVMF